MIGTIANTLAILAGSLIGGTVRRGLKEKYQTILYVAMGLAATGLGINAVVQNMPNSPYPVLFIASLAIGGVVGTAIDLEGRFNRLVEGRSRKRREGSKTRGTSPSSDGTATDEASPCAGASGDAGARDDAARTDLPSPARIAAKPPLARGLSTGIMLFCIGTLSILGPINSALYGDETFLFTNATLDFVTSMVLASTFGYGMAFAAPVLFCWQGAIYLLANVAAPYLTGGLMTEVSIVGGFLILASGLSILKIKEISTMNLLPGLFIPPIWFALMELTDNLGGLL